MKSSPASSASLASVRQSGQLADQRSGTLVAERPDEQLAPNSPILSTLPLYMAMRFCMDALRASTAFFLPDVSRHHPRDGGGDQAEGAACNWRLRCLSPTDLNCSGSASLECHEQYCQIGRPALSQLGAFTSV